MKWGIEPSFVCLCRNLTNFWNEVESLNMADFRTGMSYMFGYKGHIESWEY
jgi:hypothetical protein